jgi:hypothetical protein
MVNETITGIYVILDQNPALFPHVKIKFVSN